MKKIKVYELDFGDTNLISPSIQDILEWIKAESQNLKEGDGPLQYEITVKMLTEEEISALPEWS